MANDSNRVRIASVVETDIGVLPASPRFRIGRMTGESVEFSPQFFNSAEIRSDRMNPDPVQIFQQNQGSINYELSYPTDRTLLSDFIASAFFNSWTNTPFRDNDGTADSVITDIGTVANTVTFATGPAFLVGHLVRNTGFAQPGNNGLFPVTTGGTTSYVSTGSTFTAEAAPSGTARVKVVGYQGTAADITATGTGLASTTLDFTTLGLALGQWIKIGGTGAAFRFGTVAANNDWARITAISAHALTLDNLPVGWGADTGTGKTIRIFFGDRLINGVTRSTIALEKAFLGQAVPSYVLHHGLVGKTLTVNAQSQQAITGTIAVMGTQAAANTSPNGATYAAATTDPVMTSNISMTRVAENNAAVVAPNFIKDLSFTVENSTRLLDAVGFAQAVDIGAGDCAVTGTANTYFGDLTLYNKLINGTPSSLSMRMQTGSKALIFTLPRVIYTGGAPSTQAKNTDVMISLTFTSSIDPATNSVVNADRFDYFEI